MSWRLLPVATWFLSCQQRKVPHSIRCAQGPRAVAAFPGRGLVVGASGGVEWWRQTSENAGWKRCQTSTDPALGAPLFSVAVEPETLSVAVGGGARRSVSLFGPEGSLLGSLTGHTGWVRDLAFHGGQLFSIGCNFIKVWRPSQFAAHSDSPWQKWRTCSHVGDLEVHGDLLALSVCAGFLVAAGASKYRYRWRLPSTKLRPRDWLEQARGSQITEPSLHDGRVAKLTCWKERLLSCGHDGRVCMDSFEHADPPAAARIASGRLLSLATVGSRIAVGSEDGHIYLLGDDLQLLETRRPFHGPVNGLAALPGDRVAAVSTSTAEFRIESCNPTDARGETGDFRVRKLGQTFETETWFHPDCSLALVGLKA
ncbi:unnamed protein product [Effrenium voratum]|nr:unnamed protein product [Effrenium voratum]